MGGSFYTVMMRIKEKETRRREIICLFPGRTAVISRDQCIGSDGGRKLRIGKGKKKVG